MGSIRGQLAGIERSGFSNAGELQPTSSEIPPEQLDKQICDQGINYGGLRQVGSIL
jgi:hypothetical protein